MVLKLAKKVDFLANLRTITQERNMEKILLKQFTYLHLKGLVYARLENGIVYYAMTYFFGDICVWSWRILLNFC